MIPDLNRLKAFYYVYLHRNVSAAAQDLFVTQSAVSQNIKNLETELKCTLFSRAGRRLAPTSAAHQLFEIMKPFMVTLENGIEAIEKQNSVPAGNLRVGAPVEFGSKYLVGIFAGFRKAFPAVSFSLTLGHPSQLLADLSAGKLDIAFADIFSSGKKFAREYAVFSIKLIAQERLALICSSRYFREHLKPDYSAQDLLKCRFLDYNSHAPAVRGWFAHHFGMNAVKPELAMDAESVQSLVSGIKAGMGLGIVPEYLLEQEIKAGEAVKIRSDRPDIINKISLVRMRGSSPSPAEKAFTDFFIMHNRAFKW